MPATLSIDTAQLSDFSKRIRNAARNVPDALEHGLDVVIRLRKALIEAEAPINDRDDDRVGADYEIKLVDSFEILSRPGVRETVTVTPRKYEWVTEGTRPPTQNSGYIFPRFAQALWWPGSKHGPGLDGPIPFVGQPITRPHPGIVNGNRFVERALDKYGDNDRVIIARIIDAAITRGLLSIGGEVSGRAINRLGRSGGGLGGLVGFTESGL